MASPYRKRYLDQVQVDSDHKDIVISQLKAEAFELRENERDYNDLNSRVNNLNHRFNLLQDEKVLDEKEHSYRHEINLKTINTLRDEVDALRSDLKGVCADIEDLRDENDSVNLTVRTRSNDLAKLKGDLADLNDDNSQLNLQNKELDRQVLKVQSENKEQASENQYVNDKVAEATSKKSRNERLIDENENNVEKLLKESDDLKAHQEELRANIRERGVLIRENEHTVSENRKRIITLEARISDRRRVNEKLKTDISVSRADQEDEAEKGAKLASKIRVLQADIEERDNELDELRQQIASLRKEQASLLQSNDDLINDVKISNKHLDVVTVQNYNLVDEIEKINQEDEEVRRVLNRKERIVEVTGKCNDRMRVSTVKMNSAFQSPCKTASTGFGI